MSTRGVGHVITYNLNLGTGCGFVVSFTTVPLYTCK